jgi:hypothetical protein
MNFVVARGMTEGRVLRINTAKKADTCSPDQRRSFGPRVFGLHVVDELVVQGVQCAALLLARKKRRKRLAQKLRALRPAPSPRIR